MASFQSLLRAACSRAGTALSHLLRDAPIGVPRAARYAPVAVIVTGAVRVSAGVRGRWDIRWAPNLLQRTAVAPLAITDAAQKQFLHDALPWPRPRIVSGYKHGAASAPTGSFVAWRQLRPALDRWLACGRSIFEPLGESDFDWLVSYITVDQRLSTLPLFIQIAYSCAWFSAATFRLWVQSPHGRSTGSAGTAARSALPRERFRSVTHFGPLRFIARVCVSCTRFRAATRNRYSGVK
jgi:hypothetical protein